MKTIAFFNNKGGVGKTSLVYHLAWMYARLGVNVLETSTLRPTLPACSSTTRSSSRFGRKAVSA